MYQYYIFKIIRRIPFTVYILTQNNNSLQTRTFLH